MQTSMPNSASTNLGRISGHCRPRMCPSLQAANLAAVCMLIDSPSRPPRHSRERPIVDQRPVAHRKRPPDTSHSERPTRLFSCRSYRSRHPTPQATFRTSFHRGVQDTSSRRRSSETAYAPFLLFFYAYIIEHRKLASGPERTIASGFERKISYCLQRQSALHSQVQSQTASKICTPKHSQWGRCRRHRVHDQR